MGVAYRQDDMRHETGDMVMIYSYPNICIREDKPFLSYIGIFLLYFIYMSEKTVPMTPSVLLYPHKGVPYSRQ